MNTGGNKLPDDIENLEAKNLKYWSNFYAKEVEKYQNVLRIFGFEKTDLLLSEVVNRRFNSLMSIYQQLGMEEAIDDRFSHLREVEQLKLNSLKLEKELIEWDEKKSSINESVLKLNLFKETVSKDLKGLLESTSKEEAELEKIDGNLKFCCSKLDKYRKQIEDYERQGLNNIDQRKTHEIILFDYQSLKENERRLDELRSALKLYDDLPANMNLAKAKLEEIKQQIEFTDQENDRMMGLIFNPKIH